MTLRRWGISIGIVATIGAVVAGCSPGGRSPQGASTPESAYTPGRNLASFDVEGDMRTAVLVVPADMSRPAPLVFAFHGHGGQGASMERRSNIEDLFTAAIVVYPDGLVGHKGKTDPEGVKPGWQTQLGELEDRDIAFYDTMLATLRSELAVDPDRIYLMGHSNGSAFVSLLLNQRGDAVAATATLSAQPPPRLLRSDPVRSMFMSIGTDDPIVPYDKQQESIPAAQRKLGVDPAKATVAGYLRSEPGRGNLELATYVYPGGHAPPPEVFGLVVEFFQRHTLSGG